MALDYFAPGVYVEEVDRGSRPLEGISMNVAGFVGFTEDVRGDAELFKPIMITNWEQYKQYFAKLDSVGSRVLVQNYLVLQNQKQKILPHKY
jgi:phage tail sheath protein FI